MIDPPDYFKGSHDLIIEKKSFSQNFFLQFWHLSLSVVKKHLGPKRKTGNIIFPDTRCIVMEINTVAKILSENFTFLHSPTYYYTVAASNVAQTAR